MKTLLTISIYLSLSCCLMFFADYGNASSSDPTPIPLLNQQKLKSELIEQLNDMIQGDEYWATIGKLANSKDLSHPKETLIKTHSLCTKFFESANTFSEKELFEACKKYGWLPKSNSHF